MFEYAIYLLRVYNIGYGRFFQPWILFVLKCSCILNIRYSVSLRELNISLALTHCLINSFFEHWEISVSWKLGMSPVRIVIFHVKLVLLQISEQTKADTELSCFHKIKNYYAFHKISKIIKWCCLLMSKGTWKP